MSGEYKAVSGFSEMEIQDATTLLGERINAFKVRVDDFVAPTQTPEEWKTNFNSSTVFSIVVETPNTTLATSYTSAHVCFLQTLGSRTVHLFPPERWFDIKFYPIVSGRRRQSMLDFLSPEERVKRKIPSVAGLKVVLEEGDVLYLPPYWSFSSTTQGKTTTSLAIHATSVSFEHSIAMAMERAANLATLTDIVVMMSKDSNDKTAAAYIKRASIAYLVRRIFEKSGLKPKGIFNVMLERLLLPADGQPNRGLVSVCQVPLDLNTHLDAPARLLLDEIANTMATGRALLGIPYETMRDRGMGSKADRVDSIWHIVVMEWMERFILSSVGTGYFEIISCMANEAAA